MYFVYPGIVRIHLLMLAVYYVVPVQNGLGIYNVVYAFIGVTMYSLLGYNHNKEYFMHACSRCSVLCITWIGSWKEGELPIALTPCCKCYGFRKDEYCIFCKYREVIGV